MNKRKNAKIALFVNIILWILTAWAIVAGLGGPKFQSFFTTEGWELAISYFDQGRWGLGFGHLIDSLTLGGKASTFLSISLIVILFYLQYVLKKEPPPGSEPGQPPKPGQPSIIINNYTIFLNSIENLPLSRLKVGTEEELVGRGDEVKWLEEHLIKQQTASVAVVSLHAAGGMGKTFLSHVFATKFREQNQFLEIQVGERPALDAAVEILEKLSVDTSKINSEENLKQTLKDIYSQTEGILILDDIWRDDINILIPETIKWRVLITTRKEDLARKFTPTLLQLDVFTPEESLKLFQKVLGDGFKRDEEESYKNLAKFLSHRPYGIRLASESLKNSLRINSPAKLLEDLQKFGLPKKGGVETDAGDLADLRSLLEHSLQQLEETSSFSRQLLNDLAVCEASGMELHYFMIWQVGKTGATIDQVEKELLQAKNFSLILIEEERFEFMGDEVLYKKIRLHTDLLNILRESPLVEERTSLHKFLKQILVEEPEGMEKKRGLQRQVFQLYSYFRNNADVLHNLYRDFAEHLFRTGLLFWAYEIGESLRKLINEKKYAENFAVILGNQALLLQSWGKLNEAMVLHKEQEDICKKLGYKEGLSKSYSGQGIILNIQGSLVEAMELYKKEEVICKELGDKEGLSRSYGNQALIFNTWGKLDDAMELHKKEEAICKELGNKAGLGSSYGNQALTLKDWGKLDEAMKLLKEQEKICKELGDKAGLGNSYWNRGLLFKEMKQHDEAIKRLKESIKFQEELKDHRLEKHKKFLAEYEEELGKGK
ncbi:MAG TPA: NB-ARC domain-containing protein [Nitrospinota bacterium]|jgi:tetratricopeptide (TPR) repeat protein|nr:NB-ARC domain-containing protein [Nitrospinota bacterium]|tara:strand:+ start:2590 stop:4908 length:2319 start_codon:yes stop_codon:yes gene_type:complete